MANIAVHLDGLELESPYLVEGLPGIGLVGKIATDLLIEQFEMEYYASVQCEGLPKIGVYHPNDRAVKPPVRIYASEAENLLAIQSEVPISGGGSPAFANCVTAWIEDNNITPVYLSGHPVQDRNAEPAVFGIATGGAGSRLDDADITPPTETGAVSGPTGALLNKASQIDLDAVCLVVQSDPQFPDPEAAATLIRRGIEPITGLSVDTSILSEQAETIREQRQQLAERLQNAQIDESTQSRPIGMFQ